MQKIFAESRKTDSLRCIVADIPPQMLTQAIGIIYNTVV